MDTLMNVKDAAQYLRLNYMTVYKLARKGRIPASKVGGNWRFKKEILDNWLMQKTNAGRGSVLVIDDDPVVRDVLKEMIMKHGYTVVTADSGEAALDLLEGGHHFDLIFLDLVLPGLGGIEILQVIKERDKGSVVVVITGYGDYPVALEAMSLGPLLLIRKPFKKGDIAEVLKIVMRGAPALPNSG